MKSILSKILAATVSQFPLILLILFFCSVPTIFLGRTFGLIFPLLAGIRQALFIALLMGWLASWRKSIWWIVFAFFSIIFYGELLCLFLQSSRIHSAIAIVIRQTNTSEANEYLTLAVPGILKATGVMMVIIVMFLTFQQLWLRRFAPAIMSFLKNKRKISFTLSLLILVSLPLSMRFFVREYNRHPKYWQRMATELYFVSAPIAYCFTIEDTFFGPYEEKIAHLRQSIERMNTDISKMKDSLTVVYVIGESYNRNRSSLYGYPLNTSPRMKKYLHDGNLVVFDNVIAQSNRTIDMLYPLLAVMDAEDDKEAESAPLLPALFKHSGYTSAYYDNQSVLEDVSHFDFGCNFFFADQTIRDKSMDRHNTQLYEYDCQMIAACPIDTISVRSLTIYHLSGQHVAFDQRYPKSETIFDKTSYKRFKNITQEQAEVVAQYDNALLHTDKVLDEIIKSISNKCAVMIFTSDHGEEAHDFRNHVGRNLAGNHVGTYKVVHEVPAFIWLSDKFKAKYPDEMKRLQQNRHKALYNTDLTHTIMNLAGLRSDTYHANLSLMNNETGRTDRVILYTFHYDRSREALKKVKLYYGNKQQ